MVRHALDNELRRGATQPAMTEGDPRGTPVFFDCFKREGRSQHATLHRRSTGEAHEAGTQRVRSEYAARPHNDESRPTDVLLDKGPLADGIRVECLVRSLTASERDASDGVVAQTLAALCDDQPLRRSQRELIEDRP